MTALPLRDFTDAEQAKLAEIEAAPAAPESAVVGLAWHDTVCPEGEDCRDRPLHAAAQQLYSTGLLAQFLDRLSALAVLRGPSSDAEQAVERVLALADLHEECRQFIAVWDLRRAVAGD